MFQAEVNFSNLAKMRLNYLGKYHGNNLARIILIILVCLYGMVYNYGWLDNEKNKMIKKDQTNGSQINLITCSVSFVIAMMSLERECVSIIGNVMCSLDRKTCQ